MKRISGITLTELIVASVITSLVLLGLTATQMMVHRDAVDFSRSDTAVNEAQNICDHISRNVALAVGTKSNSGIRINSETGYTNNFCVRNASLQWYCYTLTSGSVVRGCDRGINLGLCPSGSNDEIIGTVVPNYVFNPAYDPATGIFTMTVASQIADGRTSQCSVSVAPEGQTIN